MRERESWQRKRREAKGMHKRYETLMVCQKEVFCLKERETKRGYGGEEREEKRSCMGENTSGRN